ncbi:MAG: PEP-CTERM sorting domain-containing protein [Thainema sp.]
MKHLVLGVVAGLGMGAIAAPAHAAFFSWDVEYTGWWDAEGGGSVVGSFVANDADAADGIISGDEIKSWSWSWSGNDFASAFDISSKDSAAEIQFIDGGFFVDGTPNLPNFFDGTDQGVFVGGDAGENIIDFEFLTIETIASGDVLEFSAGDPFSTTGSVIVSDPTKVPEPATIVGLLTLVALSGVSLRRSTQSA